MYGVWYLEHIICLIQKLFLVFRLIWVRSSSTFTRMIFSKLRNATMTAQSKLCTFVAVTITGEIFYNNICAILPSAMFGFSIKSWSVREIFTLFFLFLPYCRVQAFLNSDQNRCATKLLSAYEEGDAEEIKRIGQSSAFNHLDHVVIVFIILYKRPCIPVLYRQFYGV